jgi:uncharacterized protein (DUF2147 family)
MKPLLKLAPAALLLTFAGHALAGSAAGTWKTIDDNTGQPKALVQISDNGGELTGKIVKLFARPDAVCDKCEGEKKDKPIVGMTILWGLKKDGDDLWKDGKILDPKEGKIYSSKAKLADGGSKLEVRGFVGVSLLGRTQTWVRQQ